jgi:hypothetical protein
MSRYAVVVFKGRNVPGCVLGPYRDEDRAEREAERVMGVVVPLLPGDASRATVHNLLTRR